MTLSLTGNSTRTAALRPRWCRALLVAVAATLLSASASTVVAQESSLFRAGTVAASQQPQRRPLTQQDLSFIWQKPLPPNEVKLHDYITIVVDEKSLYTNQALLDREKRGVIDAVLEDNPILDSLTLKPSKQTGGDPALTASYISRLEADANHRSDGRIAFRITVEVVEIRPNGNLVLEGHRTIRNNEEVWEQSLTGIIQPDKVDAGKIAKAEDINHLWIEKRERGEVRDGYRRGWLLRFLDRVQAF